VGDDLEQRDVMIGEGTLIEPTHVEHPEKAVAGEQGNTQHHLDALLPEDRVRDRGCVDALETNRAPGGGDPTGEAAPDRNSHAFAHLFLDPAGGGGDELLLVLGEQQDGGTVGIECFLHASQQFIEQVVDLELRDRRVGQRLQALELHFSG
jgi:hypothetical protein